MEMTRGRFLRLVAGVAFLCAAGARWVAIRPLRGVRAVLAARFPGRLRPYDAAAVRREGPWAG